MGTCCKAGAARASIRSAGKLVQGWGQGSRTISTDWPREPHGIFVDHHDYVWVGSYNHHRVMKFTRDGKLLLTIGQYERTTAAPTRRCSAARRASGSIRRPTRSSSRMAIATAA